MDLSFKHPFNCIVSAPTKSGKTELVKNIVVNSAHMLEPTPIKIYLSYTEWQKAYDDVLSKMPSVDFFRRTTQH